MDETGPSEENQGAYQADMVEQLPGLSQVNPGKILTLKKIKKTINIIKVETIMPPPPTLAPRPMAGAPPLVEPVGTSQGIPKPSFPAQPTHLQVPSRPENHAFNSHAHSANGEPLQKTPRQTGYMGYPGHFAPPRYGGYPDHGHFYGHGYPQMGHYPMQYPHSSPQG